jgi:hypothetical protein
MNGILDHLPLQWQKLSRSRSVWKSEVPFLGHCEWLSNLYWGQTVLQHPTDLSEVSAPDVRYCQIKTMPCVERKDLLGIQTAGLSLSGSEWNGLAELGSGLYRRGQAMVEGERVWSLIISDHQMEQVNMPG